MRTIDRRLIGDVWYLAEADTAPDPKGLFHWHVKKLPVDDGKVILGNLTVFGVEASFEAAQRKALEALEDEARISEFAVD